MEETHTVLGGIVSVWGSTIERLQRKDVGEARVLPFFLISLLQTAEFVRSTKGRASAVQLLEETAEHLARAPFLLLSLEEYAAQRRKQYEEWDRRLNQERQRHINADNTCKAQRFVHGARKAAAFDEAFYANQRYVPGSGKAPSPPNAFGGSGTSGPKQFAAPAAPKVETAGLSAEELSVLKELQSVRLCSRDAQKAKVKDLLFKWHPDKNPDNTERATRVFQFVQKHREIVLGL